MKWAVREWLKELDGVHADPTDLDVLGLANNEAKQKPSPKTTRHTEEIEMLTLLVAKIDVNVKAPAKEEGGGEKSKEVKALVEMYRSIFEPFKSNKTMVADFKLREENKNSKLTSRDSFPAADKEEMQKQIQDTGRTINQVSFENAEDAKFKMRGLQNGKPPEPKVDSVCNRRLLKIQDVVPQDQHGYLLLGNHEQLLPAPCWKCEEEHLKFVKAKTHWRTAKKVEDVCGKLSREASPERLPEMVDNFKQEPSKITMALGQKVEPGPGKSVEGLKGEPAEKDELCMVDHANQKECQKTRNAEVTQHLQLCDAWCQCNQHAGDLIKQMKYNFLEGNYVLLDHNIGSGCWETLEYCTNKKNRCCRYKQGKMAAGKYYHMEVLELLAKSKKRQIWQNHEEGTPRDRRTSCVCGRRRAIVLCKKEPIKVDGTRSAKHPDDCWAKPNSIVQRTRRAISAAHLGRQSRVAVALQAKNAQPKVLSTCAVTGLVQAVSLSGHAAAQPAWERPMPIQDVASAVKQEGWPTPKAQEVVEQVSKVAKPISDMPMRQMARLCTWAKRKFDKNLYITQAKHWTNSYKPTNQGLKGLWTSTRCRPRKQQAHRKIDKLHIGDLGNYKVWHCIAVSVTAGAGPREEACPDWIKRRRWTASISFWGRSWNIELKLSGAAMMLVPGSSLPILINVNLEGLKASYRWQPIAATSGRRESRPRARRAQASRARWRVVLQGEMARTSESGKRLHENLAEYVQRHHLADAQEAARLQLE